MGHMGPTANGKDLRIRFPSIVIIVQRACGWESLNDEHSVHVFCLRVPPPRRSPYDNSLPVVWFPGVDGSGKHPFLAELGLFKRCIK